MSERIPAIQAALQEQGFDAWLFCDFRGRDPLAYSILGLETQGLATRRWFYLIPARGEPAKLAHRIEPGKLDSLPGSKRLYSAWGELHAGLKAMVAGRKRVAMQYSPMNNIPYVALVDAGTVELVRSFGVEVVSSANLVQQFEAALSDEQVESHFAAGRLVDQVMKDAFARVGRDIREKGAADEYTIAQFILDRFREARLATHNLPIVGVNAHAGDPHYEPSPQNSQPIRAGDWLLLDIWAKQDKPGAVYYDISWTGFCGERAPERQQQVFQIVRNARDRAVEFVLDSVQAGRPIQGWQVDDAARGVIVEAGFGEYFTHRTGHSLGEVIHGNGANMDNLETKDDRRIAPRTCFTIEPGIYLPEFGVRSELNIYVGEKEARVTGAVQTEIVRIET